MSDRYNQPEEFSTEWHIPLNENFFNLGRDVEIRGDESNRFNHQPWLNAKYFSVDTGVIYLGDGNEWIELGKVAHDASDLSGEKGDDGQVLATNGQDAQWVNADLTTGGGGSGGTFEYGTETDTGDGVTDTFVFPVDIDFVPEHVNVTPQTVAASADHYSVYDDGEITVTYNAPPANESELEWAWVLASGTAESTDISVKDDGFTVTADASELDFADELDVSSEDGTEAVISVSENVTSHITDETNPHTVTAEQVGALSTTGGSISGDVDFGGEHKFMLSNADGTTAGLQIGQNGHSILSRFSDRVSSYSEEFEGWGWRSSSRVDEVDTFTWQMELDHDGVLTVHGSIFEDNRRVATRYWATDANIDGSDLLGQDGTDGQVLTTDGTYASWQDPTGGDGASTSIDGIDSVRKNVGALAHGGYHGNTYSDGGFGVVFEASGIYIHSVVIDSDVTSNTDTIIELRKYEDGIDDPEIIETVTRTLTGGPERVELDITVPESGDANADSDNRYILQRGNDDESMGQRRRFDGDGDWSENDYDLHTYDEIDFIRGSLNSATSTSSEPVGSWYYYFDWLIGDPNTKVTSPVSSDIDELYVRPRDPAEEFDDIAPRSLWIDTS